MNDIELRNIPNYEGLYAITPSGQVWSYRKKDFLRPGERARYPLHQAQLCEGYDCQWCW